MAARRFVNVQAINQEVKIIAGSFSIAASGGAATLVTGYGYSVAKTTTGVYTVTLQDAYPYCISAVVSVQAATAVDLVAQVKSVDVSSARTLVIDLNAGATPTEPSAVTVINFILVVQNSSLPVK